MESGWWFGTFFIVHILGIIIPTDKYVSEGLKPPTSNNTWLMIIYKQSIYDQPL
jgi:hypothetical protein